MKKSKFSVERDGEYTDLTVLTECDGGSGIGLASEAGTIVLRLKKSQVQHLITILNQSEKSTMPLTADCLVEVYVHDPKDNCRVINVVNISSGQQEQVFCEHQKQLPDLIEALNDSLKLEPHKLKPLSSKGTSVERVG